MPFGLKKSGKKYYVISKDTGRKHSKKPLSKEKALRQLKAITLHYFGGK